VSAIQPREPYPRYKAPVQHSPDAPVIVLSPHLDDAVLSAWSVLTGPSDVLVVNVFAGVPENGSPPRWDRVLRATDSRELVRARIAEDREALALAGRTAVNLHLLDAQYRDGDGEPDPAELEAALAGRVPRAAALLAPAAIRAHRDHELVRDAALRLGERHGVPVALYADLPYAAYFGWPAWVTGAEPDERLDPEVDWEIALGGAPVERERLVPSVTRLDEQAIQGKLRAVRMYRTQFAALNHGPIGVFDHPSVLPFEVSWAVEQVGN
jgi:LmbE family N-acetylglucosaminyl deacetylase